MGEKTIDQEKLNKFMNDGWSWRGESTGAGTYVPTSGSVELTDKATNKQYSLYVDKGELSMKEVAE